MFENIEPTCPCGYTASQAFNHHSSLALDKCLFHQRARRDWPPMFNPALGDRVGEPPHVFQLAPRERTQDTLGAPSSTSGALHLTPGPCAPFTSRRQIRSRDCTRPVPNCIGHVLVYASGRNMTSVDRACLPQQAVCPQFVLQFGKCPDDSILAQLPSHKVGQRRTSSGTLIGSEVWSYVDSTCWI
jgi:hypothetical protein